MSWILTIKPKQRSCSCTSMLSALLFCGSSVCKAQENTLAHVFISEWHPSIQEWRCQYNTIRLCAISVLKMLESASPKQRYPHRNTGVFSICLCCCIAGVAKASLKNLKLPLTIFLVPAWRSTRRKNIATSRLNVCTISHRLEKSLSLVWIYFYEL